MIGLDQMGNRTFTLPDGRLATNLPGMVCAGQDEVWVVPCPSGKVGHYVEIDIPDPSAPGTTTITLRKGISEVRYKTANDGEVLDKESARRTWRAYIHEGWAKS